jgi:hypothetical protein
MGDDHLDPGRRGRHANRASLGVRLGFRKGDVRGRALAIRVATLAARHLLHQPHARLGHGFRTETTGCGTADRKAVQADAQLGIGQASRRDRGGLGGGEVVTARGEARRLALRQRQGLGQVEGSGLCADRHCDQGQGGERSAQRGRAH